MSLAAKPLPPIDPVTQPFWDRCAAGELCVQVCDQCGNKQLYPRLACCQCQGTSLRLDATDGTGTVRSFTIIRRAVSAAFEADVPYVVALIELGAGPTLMANVVDVDPEEVRIGQTVKVVFEQREGISVPHFSPVSSIAN